jgi:hypothetical protein
MNHFDDDGQSPHQQVQDDDTMFSNASFLFNSSIDDGQMVRSSFSDLTIAAGQLPGFE